MQEQEERVVALLYELASFDGRQAVGLPLSSEEKSRLHALRLHFEGEQNRKEQRIYRRLPLEVSCELNHQGRRGPAEIRDISAAGCLVETPLILVPCDRVELRLGRPARALYVFSALVRRIEWEGDLSRVALEFDGVPLQLRAYHVRPLLTLEVAKRRAPRARLSASA